MIDSRQNFRLRKQIDVIWSIPEQKIEGTGKVFNISMTGMLLETDKLFEATHEMVIHLRSPQIPALPPKGRLKWFQKVGEAKTHYQCGVRFTVDAAASPAWHKWMEETIMKLAEAGDNNILRRYLGE